MKMPRSYLWIAAVPAILLGCQPDIEQDPEPTERVTAVFDPATSTIPLPNTAAIEEDGTLPALEGAGEDNANGAFLDWLDGLHGWSESTPITVPFSGELSEDTVTADNVLLWKRTAEGYEQVEATAEYAVNDEDGSLCDPSVCGSVVTIVPAETPEFGATYAAVVTKGIEGAGGEPVGESAAIFFAASESPLVNEQGEVTVSVLEDDPAQAQTLEGLRQLLAPVFSAAADAGVARDQVATAFTWTIVTDPLTQLDADTATLPIPNDIALEADGTFPAAALNFCGGPDVDPAVLADESCDAPSPEFYTCEVNADCAEYREQGDPAVQCVSGLCKYTRCAQGQFDTYLDGLHGWPTTTPITLPVTQPVDPATLNDETVQLWVVGDDGTPSKVENTTVALSECGDEITITLPEDDSEMGYATKYIAFATDAVLGLADEDGNQLPLTAPAPIVLATMPYEPGEFVGDCTEEEVEQACEGGGVCADIPDDGFRCVESTIDNVPDADAAAVMAIRPVFRPVVEAIETATGTTWDQLASVWTWTTWTDTFMVFDPSSSTIPFPNTFLTSGCPDNEPICLLPEGEGATAALLDELRTREGFSSTAPHWIPTLGPPLDETSVVKEAGVLFAEADEIPPPLFPTDDWDVRFEYGHVIADFHRPIKPDILVAGLTTTDLIGSNGHPAQPTPAFVFLRSEFPLIDEDGNKTIAEIPDNETAATLEDARQDFEQLFLVALLFGYGRAEVNNAWAFDTGETYRPLQELRARTLNTMNGTAPTATANSADVVVDPGTIQDPDDVTVDVDLSNVAELHWNIEFSTYYWLDADNALLNAPTREPAGVSIAIPKTGANCTAPFDVAIAQHGHTNHRRRFLLAVANELAADCIATVAMDMPEHGGRITGSPSLHPTTLPEDSGELYVTDDFVGTKNLFQQTVIDQSVLVQMIAQGSFDDALVSQGSPNGQVFSDDTSNIGFVGYSLGAFAGTLLATIEPAVQSLVLNVVGGNYGIILKESTTYGPLLEDAGIVADTFDELQALHFIQWLGEHADPYTFAPYPVLNPLDEVLYDGTDFTDGDTLPAKDIIIQMVDGETVVPNSSTEAVARVMGVDLADTTFPTGTAHGFFGIVDADDPDGAAQDCAVQQATEWLTSSFAGTAALTTSVTDCGL